MHCRHGCSQTCGWTPPIHTVDYGHFVKRQLTRTQLTFGRYVVTLPPIIEGNETHVAHRVAGVDGGWLRRFRGGLVFKAHRVLHHSILGSRVMKKKEEEVTVVAVARVVAKLVDGPF